jgi:hypothetical protein
MLVLPCAMRRLAWHRVYADTDNEYKDLEPYGIAISSPWLAKTGVGVEKVTEIGG